MLCRFCFSGDESKPTAEFLAHVLEQQAIKSELVPLSDEEIGTSLKNEQDHVDADSLDEHETVSVCDMFPETAASPSPVMFGSGPASPAPTAPFHRVSRSVAFSSGPPSSSGSFHARASSQGSEKIAALQASLITSGGIGIGGRRSSAARSASAEEKKKIPVMYLKVLGALLLDDQRFVSVCHFCEVMLVVANVLVFFQMAWAKSLHCWRANFPVAGFALPFVLFLCVSSFPFSLRR